MLEITANNGGDWVQLGRVQLKDPRGREVEIASVSINDERCGGNGGENVHNLIVIGSSEVVPDELLSRPQASHRAHAASRRRSGVPSSPPPTTVPSATRQASHLRRWRRRRRRCPHHRRCDRDYRRNETPAAVDLGADFGVRFEPTLRGPRRGWANVVRITSTDTDCVDVRRSAARGLHAERDQALRADGRRPRSSIITTTPTRCPWARDCWYASRSRARVTVDVDGPGATSTRASWSASQLGARIMCSDRHYEGGGRQRPQLRWVRQRRPRRARPRRRSRALRRARRSARAGDGPQHRAAERRHAARAHARGARRRRAPQAATATPPGPSCTASGDDEPGRRHGRRGRVVAADGVDPRAAASSSARTTCTTVATLARDRRDAAHAAGGRRLSTRARPFALRSTGRVRVRTVSPGTRRTARSRGATASSPSQGARRGSRRAAHVRHTRPDDIIPGIGTARRREGWLVHRVRARAPRAGSRARARS